jgi:hypothetical protein
MTCPSSPKSSACMKGHGWRWPAQREMVGGKTCRAVVALLACGSRSMRAREAVSVRGGRGIPFDELATSLRCAIAIAILGR